MSGAERIGAAFTSCERRAALMPYLMGGFPDLETSLAIANGYVDGGADLIELGVPFSDPLADGPVIQNAGSAALAAGATLDGVLTVASEISARVPVVLMCYSNAILARGTERFVSEIAAVGISGLIVPDLPLEEAPAVGHLLRLRPTVLGRAALEDVEDVDLVPGERARLDDFRQQLPGPAHERLPRGILIGPGSLAEETEPGSRIAAPEDGIRPGLGEMNAGPATGHFRAEDLER